jgi:hypothetical protein
MEHVENPITTRWWNAIWALHEGWLHDPQHDYMSNRLVVSGSVASAVEESEHSPGILTNPGENAVLTGGLESSGGDNVLNDESAPTNIEQNVTPSDGELPVYPPQPALPSTATTTALVAAVTPPSVTGGPSASQAQADLNEKSPHGRYVRVSPLRPSNIVFCLLIFVLYFDSCVYDATARRPTWSGSLQGCVSSFETAIYT